MKKLTAYIVLFLCVQLLFAQDKIVLNTGDTIMGKVLEINKYEEVEYLSENDSLNKIKSGKVRSVYLSAAKKYIYVNDFSKKFFQYKKLNFLLSTDAFHMTYGTFNLSAEKVFGRFSASASVLYNAIKTYHKPLKYMTYVEIQYSENNLDRFYAWYQHLNQSFVVEAKYYFDPYGYAQWYVSGFFEYGELYSKGEFYHNTDLVSSDKVVLNSFYFTGINIGSIMTTKYNVFIMPEFSFFYGKVALSYSRILVIRPYINLKIGYNFSSKKH